MLPRGVPIRRSLIRMILLASGTALAVTTTAFCAYDLLTFRQSSVQQLTTLSAAIATNSTAALAFDNTADATDVLRAFKAEPHITAAAVYDANGRLFASYQRIGSSIQFPTRPPVAGHFFNRSTLSVCVPISLSSRTLGTLYVESDLDALYARARLYAAIVVLVIGASLPLAYLISRRLQYSISAPILA